MWALCRARRPSPRAQAASVPRLRPRRARIVLPVCAAALTALTVHAAGQGLKAGLWEIRLTKRVVDGRDMTAQLAASTAQLRQQMQQAIASAPPGQQTRLEATLKRLNGGSIGHRQCVSPEMARRNTPVIDPHGHCQPAEVIRRGDVGSFQFSCRTDGLTIAIKGEATYEADRVSTRTDLTRTSADGTKEVTHLESVMTYLGPECGDARPRDARQP